MGRAARAGPLETAISSDIIGQVALGQCLKAQEALREPHALYISISHDRIRNTVVIFIVRAIVFPIPSLFAHPV